MRLHRDLPSTDLTKRQERLEWEVILSFFSRLYSERIMTLTHRQRTFLHRLLDVYPDHRDEPVHYSTVAQALGVSNTTAYEMMKLLEKKGYVSSEYRLPDRHRGPGRSQVLFRPTWKGLRTWLATWPRRETSEAATT